MQPASVRATALEALTIAEDDSPIRELLPIHGGDISTAVRVTTDERQYLLKISTRGLPGFFAAESHGLWVLGKAREVRVPTVLAQRDGEVGFLLLEWLDAPERPDRRVAAEQLGAALARLHRRAAGPDFGLERNNYIGATPQRNTWESSWVAFFRDHRLLPQITLARQNSYLSPERERLLMRVCDRLDTWIDDRVVVPALLHGDLWSGNWLIGPNSAPVLIDPAIFYGDRETDLALTTLFGRFDESFYHAYQQTWPLEVGWQRRQTLYNLYHLLNHLNLFGETYGAAVDGAVRQVAVLA